MQRTTSPCAPRRRARSPFRPLAPFLFCALATLAAGCGSSGASESQGQGLVFLGASSDPRRPHYHDFGTLEEGDVPAHTFELQNLDPQPVTIRRLTPACSCTVGRVYAIDGDGTRIEGSALNEPILVVPPGAVLHVEFQLVTSEAPVKNRDKLMIASMTCDSPSTPFIRFEMHSLVEVPLQATPLPVDLKAVPQSTGAFATTVVATARPGSLIEVLGVASASEGLEVEIEERPIFGERAWTLAVHLVPGLAIGPYAGEVRLRVSGSDGTGEGRPFLVPVRAQVTPDVIAIPPVFAFTTFDAERGARAEGLVRALIPGERIEVLASSLSGENAEELTVELDPIDPDDRGRSPSWRARVLAPPSLAGASFTGTIHLELDHPTLPALEIQYVCRPR